MNNTKSTSWVVYRKTIHGKTTNVMNAVCEQVEWDAMQHDRPGYHTLIQAGIASEGEAERLARSSPLDGTQVSRPNWRHYHGKRLFDCCLIRASFPPDSPLTTHSAIPTPQA